MAQRVIDCGGCGAQIEVPDDYFQQHIRCYQCHAVLDRHTGEVSGPTADATQQPAPQPYPTEPQYQQPYPQQAPYPYPQPQPRRGMPAWAIVLVVIFGGVLLMGVIGIIGAMAFVSVAGEPDRARWERARTDMGQIHTALIRYQLDHSEYPDSLEAVAGSFSGDRIPHDPFTREPFMYERTERGFRLISYGADRSEGGDEIPDRDIEYTERGYVGHR